MLDTTTLTGHTLQSPEGSALTHHWTFRGPKEFFHLQEVQLLALQTPAMQGRVGKCQKVGPNIK